MNSDLHEAIINALTLAKRMAEYKGEAMLAYMIDMPLAEATERLRAMPDVFRRDDSANIPTTM